MAPLSLLLPLLFASASLTNARPYISLDPRSLDPSFPEADVPGSPASVRLARQARTVGVATSRREKREPHPAQITEPEQGANLTPGQSFHVHFTDGETTASTVKCVLRDSSGSDTPLGEDDSYAFVYDADITLPSATPSGSYQVVFQENSQDAQDSFTDAASQSVTVSSDGSDGGGDGSSSADSGSGSSAMSSAAESSAPSTSASFSGTPSGVAAAASTSPSPSPSAASASSHSSGSGSASAPASSSSASHSSPASSTSTFSASFSSSRATSTSTTASASAAAQSGSSSTSSAVRVGAQGGKVVAALAGIVVLVLAL